MKTNMKAKLTQPLRGRTVGEIVEHDDAHLLVELGIAEPADEECAERTAIFHSAQESEVRQATEARKQKLLDSKRRAAAALKAKQDSFAERLGLETADDARAMGAEKREKTE